MPEWVDNGGDWFFRSEILSEKLTRNVVNEQAVHENKPRLTRQFETHYTDDDGQVILNNFDSDFFVILAGVRIIGPAELTPARTTLGADLIFPTGPGVGPFARRPVIVCCGSAFYVPTGDGGDDWQAADLSAAVTWDDPEEWMLTNLAIPQPALDDFRKGVSFYIRTAGFGDLGPTMNTTFPTGGHFYLFWHAHGAVAAYV